MSGPPTTIPASELWLRLTQLPRPSREVDYPRADPLTNESMGRVVLQILSQQEQMVAAVAAERYTRTMLKDKPKGEDDGLGYQNVYKNAQAVEVLYRACRRVEDPTQPFFPSPTLMRDQLTPDEVGVLLSMYLEVQTELGPIVAHMSEGEMEAWIKRLVEGGSAFPLALLESAVVSELVMLMASRLYPFLTVTPSPGSPPDESPDLIAEPSDESD